MRISILGKLGAGQLEFISKLVPSLQEKLGQAYHVCTMPTHSKFWTSKQYDFSDKSKIFEHQMEALKERIAHEESMRALEKQFPNTVFVLNGSILESRYGVWGAMHNVGLLTDQECTTLYNLADKNFSAIDFMVELGASNFECKEYIYNRNYGEEVYIENHYLTTLQKALNRVMDDHRSIQSHICYASNSVFASSTFMMGITKKTFESIVQGVQSFYKRQNKI